MRTVYFVQGYRLKGTRIVGLASLAYEYVDEALAEGRRHVRWRCGAVVHQQEVDEYSVPRGKPLVLAIHGQVRDEWHEAIRAA